MNQILKNFLNECPKANLLGFEGKSYKKAETELDRWLDSKITFISPEHEQRLNERELEYALWRDDTKGDRYGK